LTTRRWVQDSTGGEFGVAEHLRSELKLDDDLRRRLDEVG
jgi:hypothetical protein